MSPRIESTIEAEAALHEFVPAAPDDECPCCWDRNERTDRQLLADSTLAKLHEPPRTTLVVTPPAVRPEKPGPAVTARCQDCTRAFTLTGRVLDQAVKLHELKHGHIVDIIEPAEANS